MQPNWFTWHGSSPAAVLEPGPGARRPRRVAAGVQLASDVAEQFLARERFRVRRTPFAQLHAFPAAVAPCSSLFWWDDETPLYEFPLVGATGAAQGYIIASSNRSLPPIHEYALEGPPLSAQLNGYLTQSLAARGIHPRSVTWYYWDPLTPVARVDVDGRGRPVYYTIPALEPVAFPEPLAVRRDPRRTWQADDLEGRWARLLDWAASPDSAASKLVLDYQKPKRYQQACQGQFAATAGDSSSNYCTPKCIAGCTCVAWALLASSYKQINQGGSNTRIWAGSTCWSVEWDSLGPPMYTCKDVSASIWGFHDLMGTTCGGSTSTSNKLKATDYWRNTWGLPWQWYDKGNVDFNFCTTITDAYQVYMFSATGPWDSLAAELLPDRAAALQSGGQPGAVGHSVAAYGYDKGNSTLLICLGWGYGFSDKWITVDPYTDRYATYVTKYAAGALALGAEALPAPAAIPADDGARHPGRADAGVSFAADIVPLFRAVDIQHMRRLQVLLDDYAYMSDPAGDGTYADHAHARAVYDTLTGDPPRMPPGGPYWSADQLRLYGRWMDGGFPP